MANYKKLTDVEVMEEVSENTMALVEENGKLKKVPCGAGFGGGGSANRYFTVCKLGQAFYSEVTYNDLKQMREENFVIPGVYIDYDNLRNEYYSQLLYLTKLNLTYEDHIQIEFRSFLSLSIKLNFYPDGTIEEYIDAPA